MSLGLSYANFKFIFIIMCFLFMSKDFPLVLVCMHNYGVHVAAGRNVCFEVTAEWMILCPSLVSKSSTLPVTSVDVLWW